MSSAHASAGLARHNCGQSVCAGNDRMAEVVGCAPGANRKYFAKADGALTRVSRWRGSGDRGFKLVHNLTLFYIVPHLARSRQPPACQPPFKCQPVDDPRRAVDIRLGHPPTSLRFEAFSGEVRKLRACRGDAREPSAPENAQMVSRCASLRFSLCGRVIRCRCLLLANATSGQETSEGDAQANAFLRSEARGACRIARAVTPLENQRRKYES